jgi:hypothetical protein
MEDKQIKHMVDRFLCWRLPENFNPDGGISFNKMSNEKSPWPRKNEPVGTNLLDATQAEEMVRFMVEGVSSVEPSGRAGSWHHGIKGVSMQSHQERVVTEKRELDVEIEKLDDFRAGKIFPTLPAEEQDMMNRQLSYMRSYSGVLADRIAAF